MLMFPANARAFLPGTGPPRAFLRRAGWRRVLPDEAGSPGRGRPLRLLQPPGDHGVDPAMGGRRLPHLGEAPGEGAVQRPPVRGRAPRPGGAGAGRHPGGSPADQALPSRRLRPVVFPLPFARIFCPGIRIFHSRTRARAGGACEGGWAGQPAPRAPLQLLRQGHPPPPLRRAGMRRHRHCGGQPAPRAFLPGTGQRPPPPARKTQWTSESGSWTSWEGLTPPPQKTWTASCPICGRGTRRRHKT